jgi:hypothetical protein
VQGLVDIANEMEQPDQVVGLEFVGLRRSQHGAEGNDLSLSVGNRDRRQGRVVGRKGRIHKMPVAVAQKVAVSGVLPPSEPSSEYCGSPLISSAQMAAIMKIIMSWSLGDVPAGICFSQLG